MIRPKDHLRSIRRTPPPDATRLDTLRLDKNEYLPGWPEDFFRRFLATVRPEHLSIHPELGPLYRKIAAATGLPVEHIVVTAGSDAAIKAVFEVFVQPGDEVVAVSPTFAMYYVYAKVFQARLVEIEYGEDLRLDLDRLIEAITPAVKLVAIPNPNSPTGTVLARDELLAVADRASQVGAVLLVDEAYYPFYPGSVLDEVTRRDNLVVTRTFSKAAGLAGMRAGFLASSREIAGLAFAVKPMYEITTLSAMLAEYFLGEYTRLNEYAEQVRAGKDLLARFLAGRGFEVFAGHANFLHVDFGGRRDEIVPFLQDRGVLFKDRFDHPSLRRFCRFTVGPADYTQRLVDILDLLP